eukprot:TRINITY_DN3608_c0_g1_i2.p1 TRINITY_DN3608_c0_g1~~TRINITY_DN3608_c0_g1_i2.p1  ORF type:complete len:666 (-),score=170.35 TRINITY_DN3608_c0_g1_i2:13-2010(-)
MSQSYLTHNFRGHSGVVTAVAFHAKPNQMQLISASEDCSVRLWDLVDRSCVAVLSSHAGVPTSLAFDSTGWVLFSGGRDRVVNKWDLRSHKLINTLPVFEVVESIAIVTTAEAEPPKKKKKAEAIEKSQPKEVLVTAGAAGVVRIWDPQTGKCLSGDALTPKVDDNADDAAAQALVAILWRESTKELVAVGADQDIHALSFPALEKTRTLVGFLDEVVDVAYLPGYESLVVATNSEKVRVLSMSDWACTTLEGHTGIVLSVSVSPSAGLIATASKDNSVRLWDIATLRCVAVGEGHTDTCAVVAFTNRAPVNLISASPDKTIKLWDLSALRPGSTEIAQLRSLSTTLAHEKDINGVSVSPNDKIIATASQDRTAKLWNTVSGGAPTLHLTLKGHTRGVWCVAFSPVDAVVATGSADKTLKIWSVTDGACLRTFQGSAQSILRVAFVSRGMQLVSSSADGLVKLWTVKTNECVNTFDKHESKVWGLCVRPDEQEMVTVGADSQIIVWRDVTQELAEEDKHTTALRTVQEQQLHTLLHKKDFVSALRLVLELDHPLKMFSVFQEIVDSGLEWEGILGSLSDDHLNKVIKCVCEWNTNAKYAPVAQTVLSVLFTSVSIERLKKCADIKTSVEGLQAYSERHFARLDRLQQKVYFLDYTLGLMRDVAGA